MDLDISGNDILEKEYTEADWKWTWLMSRYLFYLFILFISLVSKRLITSRN